MDSHQNSKLIRRFIEKTVNRDDVPAFKEFISKDVVIHGPGSDQEIHGLAEVQKIDASYNRAYPGKKFEIVEIFSQEDRVFVRWICRGMHKKKLDFLVTGFSIYRITKGKISEAWQFWDRLGLLEQIGEIRIRRDPAHPEDYENVVKGLGMEKYLEEASLLTTRERQCLKGLLKGNTAKDTANLYKLSHRTVESYFENLKRKLKCLTKRDLFKMAQELEKLDLL